MRIAAVLVSVLLLGACTKREDTERVTPLVEDRRDAVTSLVDARARARPRFRAQLLGELARAAHLTRSSSRAATLLELAERETLALTDPVDRERQLIHTADTAHRLGRVARAQELAALVARPDARAEAQGIVDDDLERVEKLPQPHRDQALARLGAQLARAGRHLESGAALARVRDNAVRAPALAVLAQNRLERGEDKDVANWTRTLEGVAKSEVQAQLAVHYLRQKKFALAERAVDAIESEPIRARALAAQAAALPVESREAARRFAAARKLAEQVRDPELQRSAYEGLILGTLTRVGSETDGAERAGRLIELLGDLPGGSRLASITAAALADEGHLREALRLKPRFEADAVWGAEGLGALARAHAARQEHEAALAALAQIPQLEQRLPALARAAWVWGVPADPAEREALIRLIEGEL